MLEPKSLIDIEIVILSGASRSLIARCVVEGSKDLLFARSCDSVCPVTMTAHCRSLKQIASTADHRAIIWLPKAL
jgi:hypothetical protein